MIKNGLDRILISVRNMEESLAFYRDLLKMTVVTDEPLPSQAVRPLWHLPEGTGARSVLLRMEEQITLLELIEFHPHSGQFIRSNAKTYDYGLFDVAFRAKSVDAAYQDLKARGYDFICPPTIYNAEWTKVTAKEALMIGPNQMPIALIERLSEPKPVIQGDYGVMVDSAQFVEDMDQVTRFYVEVLGLNKFFDQPLPEGLIDDVVRLPAGTKSRMAFVIKPGSNAIFLEFLQTTAKADYLAPVAKPPNIGLFSIALETTDLAELTERIRGAGFPVLSGPVEIARGSYEKIRAITVAGPSKVLLQFYEK
jgi:catechol 2,3-dioxygenase-like lactoylglutathione lyase family enzyme